MKRREFMAKGAAASGCLVLPHLALADPGAELTAEIPLGFGPMDYRFSCYLISEPVSWPDIYGLIRAMGIRRAFNIVSIDQQGPWIFMTIGLAAADVPAGWHGADFKFKYDVPQGQLLLLHSCTLAPVKP